ncbi:MAG: hypothetical protein U0133_06470 [Gemmatimonadales bacterium]
MAKSNAAKKTARRRRRRTVKGVAGGRAALAPDLDRHERLRLSRS